MKTRQLSWLLVLAGAVAFTGCAPRIAITRLAPAPQSLGAARKLAVKVIPPPEDPVTVGNVLGAVVQAGMGQLMRPGNSVQHLEADVGIHLSRPPFVRVDVSGAEVLMRVHPVSWTYRVVERSKTVTEEKKEVEKVWPAASAVLAVQVEFLNSRGEQFRTLTYQGEVEEPGNPPKGRPQAPPSEPDALRMASARAVQRLFDDITPRHVTDQVVMDDEGDEMKEAIRLAKEGAIDASYAELSRVATAMPTSAAARYNLGVILESRGELDQAEALYREAMGIERKKLYSEALEHLQSVRSDQSELYKAY